MKDKDRVDGVGEWGYLIGRVRKVFNLLANLKGGGKRGGGKRSYFIVLLLASRKG